MMTFEQEFEIPIEEVNEFFIEAIICEKDEDDYIKECLLRDERATWYEYTRPMKPRRDWQRKPFWLRVRSNPHRRGYH